LGVVAMADGLQELLAQVVGGGYGIVQCVLPIQRVKVLGGLRLGRILITGLGGNLGYISRTGIKMRWGQYALPRQDADTTVAGLHGGRLLTEDPAVQTSMCIEAGLSRCTMGKVLWAVECSLLGYKDV